jgi:uncharacterized protein (DUF58 family)
VRLRRRSATADDAPVRRDLTGSDSGAEPASARTREVLRRLELDVNQRLDGLLHGDHRGLVPGHGSELGETRSYAPGDDVRRIDWNVTARLSEAHIRETIAERELETWLLLDRSARLDFGTRSQEKRDLVVAAAGAVGFLTNRDGNRIGAMLAGRGAPEILPPRGSRRHLLHILSSISQAPRLDGDGVTDLAAAARQLGSVAKRRGLVVVVSDFWVQPGWEDALRVLARRHEMLAVEVVDPIELELPDVGLLPVRDPATGRVHEVATHKASVREAYAAAAAERRVHIANSLRAGHIDHLVLRTDQPWLDDLVRFLAMRRHRMLARAGGRA